MWFLLTGKEHIFVAREVRPDFEPVVRMFGETAGRERPKVFTVLDPPMIFLWINRRALGNRSLLADPRRPDTRGILNRRIKHREDFRPFAPSVLAEHADDWFEVGPHLASHEYMLFSCPVRTGYRERIPAVVQHDGTARLQLVRREANPRFHDLISSFFKRTGVPLVLNTSFNDSEPIVCTPAHAIATYRSTGLDALFMGDKLPDIADLTNVAAADRPPAYQPPST